MASNIFMVDKFKSPRFMKVNLKTEEERVKEVAIL